LIRDLINICNDYEKDLAYEDELDEMEEPNEITADVLSDSHRVSTYSKTLSTGHISFGSHKQVYTIGDYKNKHATHPFLSNIGAELGAWLTTNLLLYDCPLPTNGIVVFNKDEKVCILLNLITFLLNNYIRLPSTGNSQCAMHPLSLSNKISTIYTVRHRSMEKNAMMLFLSMQPRVISLHDWFPCSLAQLMGKFIQSALSFDWTCL
jgi:hypothetical protein